MQFSLKDSAQFAVLTGKDPQPPTVLHDQRRIQPQHALDGRPVEPDVRTIRHYRIDDIAGTAVLYLEYECGAQCGSGRLVNLVQSDDGSWRITTGELIWITSPE